MNHLINNNSDLNILLNKLIKGKLIVSCFHLNVESSKAPPNYLHIKHFKPFSLTFISLSLSEFNKPNQPDFIAAHMDFLF